MYITLCTRCMKSLDMGSTYESYLASRLIGLVAITIGYESNAYELMELIPRLSLELESGSDFKKLSVLDCLAVTTFFGTNNADEIFLGINVVDDLENTMGIFWEIVSSTWTSTHGLVSSALLAKAISAWSFLLSAIDGCRISPHKWKESCSILFDFLEADDCWVRIAAAEAVAVIFETGRLSCFSKSDIDVDEIICRIKKCICKEGKAKEDVNNKLEPFEKVLNFLEDGNFHEVFIWIPEKCSPLKVSTYARYIQLKFLKHFLRRIGFLIHLQGNTKIHALFDSREAEKSTEEVFYELRDEEDTKANIKETEAKETADTHESKEDKAEKKGIKKLKFKARDKERNQLRNKQRMRAQD